MFHRTPKFLPWLYPNLMWRVPTSEKNLYLTLDDGPVMGPTEFALDTLKEFNVKATFFCIGDNIRKHPEVFERVLADGHAVGNHTFNHLNGWRTSTANYLENVELCKKQISRHPIESNKLFRPPYGRITRAQIRSLEGYSIVMWDVLTYDYNQALNPETCLKRSIKATRPGSIIVFHDSVKAERNMMYALPRFVEHFLSKGFSFRTLHHES